MSGRFSRYESLEGTSKPARSKQKYSAIPAVHTADNRVSIAANTLELSLLDVILYLIAEVSSSDKSSASHLQKKMIPKTVLITVGTRTFAGRQASD